jgi:SAM-dependent methyltransferase
MNVYRRGSVERERTYWNAAFKLGAGPSSPLRLLQEAIRNVKPGRALDIATGRGRNAIYLAANGWDTTAYDMAADALAIAQAAAKEAGVKLTTVQATHDSFDFGESKWDLILCSYCYMGPVEAKWPGVFWKALRPGGLVVFQVAAGQPAADPQAAAATPPRALDWMKLSEHWKQFHILRLEDQDPGYIDDEWTPSLRARTFRMVARKE